MLVAGSIGPLGVPIEPIGRIAYEEARAQLAVARAHLVEAELDQAQAALASSRREVQQWRAHGSRVLEAMQQAQRLADQSGTTARELDSYLERSSRLFDPRVPDLGTLAGSSVATPGERVSVFRRQCSSLLGAGRFTSREVRFAAALPLLIGALASAKVMWDTRGDAPLFEASDQQAQHARGPQGEGALIGVEGDAGMLAAALTGPVDARAAREARAALAAFEPVSPAGRGQTDFDPRVQRQQHDLLALGFDLGHSRADGVMGARTQQALNEFEALYVPATGLESLSDPGQLVATLASRAREDAARLDISSGVLAAIQLGHMRTGVAFSYLAELAAVESRFDPTTRSASSSATGLYQFTADTWLQVLRAHGEKYGLADYVVQIEYVPNGSGGGRLVVGDPEWRQQSQRRGELDHRIAALQQSLGRIVEHRHAGLERLRQVSGRAFQKRKTEPPSRLRAKPA